MKKYPIGFNTSINKEPENEKQVTTYQETVQPKKSVVQVYFPHRGMGWACYNDSFDLKVGDFVYVEGKLEGYRGRVTEVNYSFKIKLSDYKKVIAVIDTNVKGDFYLAGSHIVSFDRSAIPYSKVLTWFKSPGNDDEYVSGNDDTFVLSKSTPEEKSKYLKGLFEKTYISDVIERNKINNDKDVLEDLLNILSSAIGSLTNPSKLSKTFKSLKNVNISSSTISKYIDYFAEAYIVNKAERYDIKGKKYMETPLKYYYTDVGLRNTRLNFRQMEENHIMENIIYNELVAREFNVNVGVVEYNHKDRNGKKIRSQLEIDFVVNTGSNRYYIQSALSVADEEKRQQEINSLKRVADSFKKIVVVKDAIIPWHDEDGIYYVGIEQFLLDENCINL